MRGSAITAGILFLLLIFVTACTGHDPNRGLSLIKETDHSRFFSPEEHAGDGDAISKLAEAFEANYSRITNFFQYESADKMSIHVYTNKADFQKMIGRDTEGTYVASENIIKVYTPANLTSPEAEALFTDQVVHEFVHAVIQSINPDVGRVKWLDEGIAYYASGQLEKELQMKTVFYDQPTFEQFSSPNYFENAGGRAYFYSGTIIQYIIDQYGIDALNEMIRNPEQKQLERVLNTTINQLFIDWTVYLLKVEQ
ncbi:peptidase MA family metallohydrolase [Paenibacillus paeoniae]|uniref:Peptidase MA-like domain-containing protein n=1 Tax=Paenibacillus paeoniae TaxID=2292705 RepID=A0A371PGX7_9BACL|nr:hypothetical protein [Paenibacillus paeoniae]REK75105.1 hypothetical protein DX130_15855 [Paenibacillus paeoniae]